MNKNKTQLLVLQSEEAIAKNLESWVQLDFLLHFKVKVYYMEAKISIGVKINHFQIQSELKFSKMMFQSEPGMQSVPWQQHVDVAIVECAELKNECVVQCASRVTEVCDFQAWYRALDCSKWQVLLPTFVFVYGCVYGENDRKKFDSRGSPWSYTCEMLSYVSKGTIEISFYSLTFPWEWKTNCDKLLGFFFDMHV